MTIHSRGFKTPRNPAMETLTNRLMLPMFIHKSTCMAGKNIQGNVTTHKEGTLQQLHKGQHHRH